jgi:ATP-dependent helicase/nuclease subunit B
LTRAAKRAGAPTVPSRFLQRLAALVGEEVWAECAQRGRTYQQWAQRIDHPSNDELSHARRLSLRPRPAPPLDLRPRQLSVTRIETLRRDPYAIYAEYILRLIPLDPIGAASGAREMGTLIHELMARYARQWRAHAPSQYDVMQALAQEQLRTQLANHAFRLFQWPHYWRALEHFMHWDEQRRGQISDLFIETNGRLDVLLDDGSSFRLTAQADRIEASTDGLRIIDFKTGRIPTFKQIKAGFAPQLTLETIMAEKGGFADIAAQNVAEAFYVKFRADEGAQIRHAADKDMSLATLAAQHYAGLLVLLNQFRSPDMVYPARPYPQYVNEFSDYDHLARVKEWSIAGTGEGE